MEIHTEPMQENHQDIADSFIHPPLRKGSDSEKWARYDGNDILPLWVADMDFPAPPAVLAALKKRLRHGVLGYGRIPPSLLEATRHYLNDKYAWDIDEKWLVWLPGLVTGLNVACRSISPQSAILTNTPVYPPFLSAPPLSGQTLQTVPLIFQNARWHMDREAMETAVTPNTRLLLLCHPHNPVGRIWNREELEWVAGFALKHNLFVCSDEIHCDLLLDTKMPHLPFAKVSEEAKKRSITLMSPSKTFNIPGLSCAFAIIPEPALRQQFLRAMKGIVPHPNILGLVACEAAFREGASWHQTLLRVLRENRDNLEKTIALLPNLSMSHVEATYLGWVNACALLEKGIQNPAAYFEKHGLGFSNGADFGTPGWVRFNFACAPDTLNEALARLKKAVLALYD